jgi:hypothetical protein
MSSRTERDAALAQELHARATGTTIVAGHEDPGGEPGSVMWARTPPKSFARSAAVHTKAAPCRRTVPGDAQMDPVARAQDLVHQPNTTASSYFHGSWPTRPGSSHVTHTTRKSAVLSGVRVPSQAMRPTADR